MKTVLIVTHQHGFEADPVINALRRLNIPVFRFNLDDGQNVSGASIILTSSSHQTLLFCDNRSISSANIGIGWCQQLWPYTGQVADQKACLQRRNLLALQSESFDLIGVPWLNRPTNAQFASNKIRQLIYAQSVGLNVIETLISNIPDDIRKFCSQFPSIAKSLATPWIVEKQNARAAYTRMVRGEWLNDDEALSFSPVIYQRFCKRRKDIRVVVVDGKVFAAQCIPNQAQIEDVRLDGATGQGFIVCDFDKKIMEQLLALMRKLSIEYCSADFMEDEDGILYFLETNVCGAWWWVDRLYNGAICQTIVNYFHLRLLDE
jgi:glutathione synthase/RimK-type ligase-like ATP-grasp enzyme